MESNPNLNNDQSESSKNEEVIAQINAEIEVLRKEREQYDHGTKDYDRICSKISTLKVKLTKKGVISEPKVSKKLNYGNQADVYCKLFTEKRIDYTHLEIYLKNLSTINIKPDQFKDLPEVKLIFHEDQIENKIAQEIAQIDLTKEEEEEIENAVLTNVADIDNNIKEIEIIVDTENQEVVTSEPVKEEEKISEETQEITETSHKKKKSKKSKKH